MPKLCFQCSLDLFFIVSFLTCIKPHRHTNNGKGDSWEHQTFNEIVIFANPRLLSSGNIYLSNTFLNPPKRTTSTTAFLVDSNYLKRHFSNVTGRLGSQENTNIAKVSLILFVEDIRDFSKVLTNAAIHFQKSLVSIQIIAMISSISLLKSAEDESFVTIVENNLPKMMAMRRVSKYFNIASRLCIAIYNEVLQNVSAEIWELYWIKEKPFMKLLIKEAPYSNFVHLVDAVSIKPPPTFIRRQNWEGVNFTSGVFLAELANENEELLEASEVSRHEVSIRRTKQGKLELMPSLSVKILHDFQSALNFTIQVIPPFTYDINLPDVFNDSSHSFDLVLSHFGIVGSKLEYSQFLLPTYYSSITAFFVQPPIHSYRNIFLGPLSFNIWILITSSWLLIVMSFKGIIWARALLQTECKKESEAHSRDIRHVDKKVGQDIHWWAVAAACQQGWYITPTGLPTRVVFITGLFFSFLCYSSYTATIVSQLSQTSAPVKNIDQLLDITKHIYFGGNSDVSAMILKRMSSDKSFLRKINLVSTRESVEQILRKNRGYSCHLGWPEYFTERVKKYLNISGPFGSTDKRSSFRSNLDEMFCKEVSTFNYKLLPIKAAMLVHKDSPFVKVLNHRILIGMERGYIHRYWDDFERHTKVRCVVEKNLIYALGLPDTWIAFVILLVGYLTSVSILMTEIVMGLRKGLQEITF